MYANFAYHYERLESTLVRNVACVTARRSALEESNAHSRSQKPRSF